MLVANPNVSIKAFIWCLNHDSMTGYCVLIHCSTADRLIARDHRCPPFRRVICGSCHIMPSLPFPLRIFGSIRPQIPRHDPLRFPRYIHLNASLTDGLNASSTSTVTDNTALNPIIYPKACSPQVINTKHRTCPPEPWPHFKVSVKQAALY